MTLNIKNISEKELINKINHYDNSHEWDGEFNDELYVEFATELKGIYKKLFNKIYIPKRDGRRKCGHCYQKLEIKISYPINVKKYIKRFDGGNGFLCNWCYENLIGRYEK